MVGQVNARIVGEFRNYRDTVLASPPEAVERNGDVVHLTRRIDLEKRSDGSFSSLKSLQERACVGGPEERIVERYSFDSIFGVQELAWRVETEYAAYPQDGRTIIEKTSKDVVRDTTLSCELVDLSTGVVLDEWFISDYRQRVLEPRHACG